MYLELARIVFGKFCQKFPVNQDAPLLHPAQNGHQRQLDLFVHKLELALFYFFQNIFLRFIKIIALPDAVHIIERRLGDARIEHPHRERGFIEFILWYVGPEHGRFDGGLSASVCSIDAQ